MRDAVAIVVVHISRQQNQSLLYVGQGLRFKAGANFLQRVDESCHFVGCDLPVQPKTIKPAISLRTPASVSSAIALRGDRTSAFGWWVNAM